MPEQVVAFDALLEPGGPSFMPTQVVVVPLAVVEALGGRSLRRVAGTLNGYAVRLGLQPLKTGERYLIINKELCKAAGVHIGQQVQLRLAPDPAPDYVELPPELEEGLAAWPEAEAAFQQLNGSMKRALAQHIGEAKRPETRTARLLQALERLARGGHPFRKL